MKVLVILSVIGMCFGEAPYPPSGWKPQGAAFTLPNEYGPPQPEQQQGTDVEITQENVEYAGQLGETTTDLPSNEYLPPTTTEVADDNVEDLLRVQGLPSSNQPAAFQPPQDDNQLNQGEYVPPQARKAQTGAYRQQVQQQQVRQQPQQVQQQQQQQFGRLRQQPQQQQQFGRLAQQQPQFGRLVQQQPQFGRLVQQQPQFGRLVQPVVVQPQPQQPLRFQPNFRPFSPQTARLETAPVAPVESVQQAAPSVPAVTNAYGPPKNNEQEEQVEETEEPEQNQQQNVKSDAEEVSDDGENNEEEQPAGVAVSNAFNNGQYFILGPDNILQRVVYMTAQTEDDQPDGFSAQLKYSPVEPIRDPVYSYDAQGQLLRVYNRK